MARLVVSNWPAVPPFPPHENLKYAYSVKHGVCVSSEAE